MVSRVLIANRGEIALRILRACRESGIETVAAHSRVDDRQLHLRYANETVCIGDTSYLDSRQLIAAALSRRCDAVHPGYGMLSENAEFAAEVESAGLRFIGPASETIARMADKQSARELAASHGLNLVPGPAQGLLETADEAARVADQIGYPVILKAVHGGGGRGMRVVRDAAAMSSAFDEARLESEAGFSHGELYLEKYLQAPRHIEVQVLGDGQGNAVHLGSRECSIQRRHQKLLEEAPARRIDKAALDDLTTRCAGFAAAIGYRGAGTFEFLYQSGEFYFIEMNTRIQVEHPVTEMITGIDLVKAQLQVAIKERLPVVQSDVSPRGHAIECRINAEAVDPQTGAVTPSPGMAYDIILPGGPGIRVDTHLYTGYLVPHHYDSLIAKLIAWGRDREECIDRMVGALEEFEVNGVDTNANLMRQVVSSERFRQGEVDTHFLDNGFP
ncbi:MAG TPA: acetyl-CoA carboxylase biotin carboxylase subunit [Pseudomonadales bacterium]|nr:acetyl-CoA carboxylase biotin carboxylase subunit [Pseudomonadales bacterium]